MSRARLRAGAAALLAAVAVASAVAAPAALAAPTTATLAAAAAVPSTFSLTGSGYGHGVGLSQYGALGQAREGRSARQIVEHYYSGASVAAVRDDRLMRVNLRHAVTSATLQTSALATGGGAVQVTLGTAAPLAGTAADVWRVGVSGTNVALTRNGSPAGAAPVVTFRWAGTLDPGTSGTAGTLMSVDGTRYRRGSIDVQVVGGRLEVVLRIRLHDEYLYGLGEMPSSWPAAALQAQVIAARSYALSKALNGTRAACACDVYDDTYDQVYAGYGKESGSYGSAWIAAVQATFASPTTGLAVTYAGAPITAYFSSSSGGRTQNSEDVWVSALPWARSVDDHWSLDPGVNPTYARWTRSVSQATAASAFGLHDVARMDLSQRYASGGIRVAVGYSSSGASATITGEQLRSRLGLPSTWVYRPTVRYAGADRWSTAVAIGRAAAPTGTSVVVVSGEEAHLVDGMVAAPLAKKLGAPILLAQQTGLPAVTRDEVARRGATTAYLIGGSGSLGPAVEEQLRAAGVSTIDRIAGADRVTTAVAVAQRMGITGGGGAIVVNATDIVGALAAGGPAARAGQPLLLTGRDEVPAATAQALTDLGVISTTVVGGTGVVSDAVAARLPVPWRAAGADRFQTAALLADRFSPVTGTSTVLLASGVSLVDAMAGGAFGRPLLLTVPTALPSATATFLRTHPVGTVAALGGTGVVPSAVLTAASRA